MTTFKIELTFSVSENWIEDGFDLTDERQIERIKRFFEDEMLSYAMSGIETKVKDLKVKKLKS